MGSFFIWKNREFGEDVINAHYGAKQKTTFVNDKSKLIYPLFDDSNAV